MSEALTVYSALKSQERQIAGWIPREWARDQQDRQKVLAEVLRHADMQCRAHFQDKPITQATAASIYLAVVTFAQARVIPNKALGLGYFIPYGNIVTPVFGYKGLRQCVGREAGVRVAYGQAVVEGDGWNTSLPWDERWRSWEPGPQHTPSANPALWLAAFSRMRWPDGFEDVMTVGAAELRERRDRAVGKRTGTPWHDWPLQMLAKTVLRRHITSGRVEMAGDGFAPMADSMGEGARLRALAEMVASRQADASDAERDALVRDAIEIEEEVEQQPERQPPARGVKAAKARAQARSQREQPPAYEPDPHGDPEPPDDVVLPGQYREPGEDG